MDPLNSASMVNVKAAFQNISDPAKVPLSELVDTFCMTCLHAEQVVPFAFVREVLERTDLQASQLLAIADRFFCIVAIETMPEETPKAGSMVEFYLKVALMARSFAHQAQDPELNPDAWKELSSSRR